MHRKKRQKFKINAYYYLCFVTLVVFLQPPKYLTVNGACDILRISNQQTELKMTIATELPKGLTTENEILDAAFILMKQQMGIKTARYYFCYHEDYPSDVINEYFWLQEQTETM
jgi:hypothetical protein